MTYPSLHYAWSIVVNFINSVLIHRRIRGRILNINRTYGHLSNGNCAVPDNKVHWANMGPTWVLSAPDGPHVGPFEPCYQGWLACSLSPNVAMCQWYWLILDQVMNCGLTAASNHATKHWYIVSGMPRNTYKTSLLWKLSQYSCQIYLNLWTV